MVKSLEVSGARPPVSQIFSSAKWSFSPISSRRRVELSILSTAEFVYCTVWRPILPEISPPYPHRLGHQAACSLSMSSAAVVPARVMVWPVRRKTDTWVMADAWKLARLFFSVHPSTISGSTQTAL